MSLDACESVSGAGHLLCIIFIHTSRCPSHIWAFSNNCKTEGKESHRDDSRRFPQPLRLAHQPGRQALRLVQGNVRGLGRVRGRLPGHCEGDEVRLVAGAGEAGALQDGQALVQHPQQPGVLKDSGIMKAQHILLSSTALMTTTPLTSTRPTG